MNTDELLNLTKAQLRAVLNDYSPAHTIDTIIRFAPDAGVYDYRKGLKGERKEVLIDTCVAAIVETKQGLMKVFKVDFTEVRRFASAKSAEELQYACAAYGKGNLLLAYDHNTRVGLVGWVVGGSASLGRIHSKEVPTLSATFGTVRVLVGKGDNNGY